MRKLNVSQFAIAFVTVVLSGSAYAQGPSNDSMSPTGRASSGAERRSVDLQDALSQLSRGANDHGATGGGEIVLAAGRVKRAVSSVKEGAKHKWNSVKKGASNLTGKRVKGAGKHSTAAGPYQSPQLLEPARHRGPSPWERPQEDRVRGRGVGRPADVCRQSARFAHPHARRPAAQQALAGNPRPQRKEDAGRLA